VKDLVRSPKQLGNLIRTARKRKNLSQRDLASATGLRQEQISIIENGYGSTKLHTLLAICAALDLDIQIVPRATDDWNLP
jgi:HTH-type transcriptional regulator / antitoxin HipB